MLGGIVAYYRLDFPQEEVYYSAMSEILIECPFEQKVVSKQVGQHLVEVVSNIMLNIGQECVVREAVQDIGSNTMVASDRKFCSRCSKEVEFRIVKNS